MGKKEAEPQGGWDGWWGWGGLGDEWNHPLNASHHLLLGIRHVGHSHVFGDLHWTILRLLLNHLWLPEYTLRFRSYSCSWHWGHYWQNRTLRSRWRRYNFTLRLNGLQVCATPYSAWTAPYIFPPKSDFGDWWGADVLESLVGWWSRKRSDMK